MKNAALAVVAAMTSLSVWGQRPATSSAKFDFTEIPTVPEELVRDLQFMLHADPQFFNLEDLRRWGGNAAILKEGERLSGMSYYTYEREVAFVEADADLIIQVALGEGSMGRRTLKSEAVKGEEQTYWYLVDYDLPVTVQLTDADGELLDGFELPSGVTVRYGNEKVSTMDSGNGSFSYSRSKLDFRSESDLEVAVRTLDAGRFIRRKAVLTQLSNLVDILETRLYFNNVKAEVNVATAKHRKIDYTALDAAQNHALDAFKAQDWAALEGPMATWEEWLQRADLMNPKAEVNKPIARALHMNLAQAHLYRQAFAECARHLQAARGLTVSMEPEWAEIEALRTLLANRRKGASANAGWAADPEAETFKAIDLKDVLGKRSENKDIDMFSGTDVYAGFTEALRSWQAVAEADAPERQAAEATEQTLAQRLGNRIEPTIGGFMLRLNPLLDGDLTGGALPEEILSIDRLVYLDVSGMGFTSLPDQIGRCGTLSTLVLTNNALTTLPESIGELGSLKKLVLKGNPLSSMPASLQNCPELKQVDVRGTGLTPEAIGVLQRTLPAGCKLKFDE